MAEWQKTSCGLCLQSCGLQVLVEDNRITKVRPDKDNPRSQGYACRKGLNIAHLQHHAQRLESPLKKTAQGFEAISWDRALAEIAERLQGLIAEHSPDSLALMAGGGGGCQIGGRFSGRLLFSLGSKNLYTALGQEWTGRQHVRGLVYGNQPLLHHPDHHRTEVLLGLGWNGWSSHGMPQTRRLLQNMAKDPDKKLIIIDPRPSETARLADIHLALTPGSDALLLKAMIAVILEKGWPDKAFLEAHTTGLEGVFEALADFPIDQALAVCGLERAKVEEACRLMAGRPSAIISDLGILMNRHSTLVSFLEEVLLTVCGRIGAPGGNIFTGTFSPPGSHTPAGDPATARTKATNIPAIMGVLPPNVLPEEIEAPGRDRIRAVFVSGANPCRSYADTQAYERSFKKLDLLITLDVALTETAALSDYVLPGRTAYESWDCSFWSFNFPEMFLQLRRPVVRPAPQTREMGWIYTALAKQLGLVPAIPASLTQAAQGDLGRFSKELAAFVKDTPGGGLKLPFILAETLGQTLASPHQAFLWALLWTAPPLVKQALARAGFPEGPDQAGRALQAVLDHPSGLWLGKLDSETNLQDFIAHQDGLMHFEDPQMLAWLKEITPAAEVEALRPAPEFPLVLMAGYHIDTNANTLMRDPAWNQGKRSGCLAVNQADAEALNLADGDRALLTTQSGRAEVEVQLSPYTRPGMVLLPQGFGLNFNGQTSGVNVNALTHAQHRDRLAATPLHRRVPCRLEKVGD